MGNMGGIFSILCDRILRKRICYASLFFFVGIYFSCRNGNSIPAENSAADEARPWVFWYWMHGAVSAEGITADLEAMQQAGIGGAYLFAIKDTSALFEYPAKVRQLTPGWWKMVRFAFSEADRLGLKMAFHACDGFTTAGGPWITPDLSMQKVVWSDTLIDGRNFFEARMPQPEAIHDYYRDIALFAFPAPEGAGESSHTRIPVVSTDLPGEEVQFLATPGNSRLFTSRDRCMVQYSFSEPFTCRSAIITTNWHNYQANRLILEVSDDGVRFRRHDRLEPYRHGWQDLGVTSTHLINPVTARYFRFVFDPAGSEPGAEDLDNAKWAPELRLAGIELSGLSRIGQYEGKSGAIWRISPRTGSGAIPALSCIDPAKLIDITRFLDEDGILRWEAPAGRWMLLRMGHTSTGHTNYTGGGGLGLECDKLNPDAVTLQFDRWFGEAFRNAGPEAEKVLKIFHVDSWECGSQNWSTLFPDAFRKKRGYDLLPWLPVMAGYPVKEAGVSEKVLYDIRMTLSELMEENFFGVLATLAKEKNCLFSAESTAPVFAGDGMAHYRFTDIPMGEFWFRSPSHDKPNDILDAVSAGHIYGKRIIQAESFTEIRLDWDEHPGMLKSLADRNFAAGINRFAFHVFTHNPWTDLKPGMTLDKVGTFLQRDQTWWSTGTAWVRYLTNVQGQLQRGVPVVDIAVFTGEELPRRAILPQRLVEIMPGITGEQRVVSERQRVQNDPILVREMPDGVKTVANMADPGEWCDPLRGYKYDSFNQDALLRLARVEKGRIVLPSGASYGLLVIPGTSPANPGGYLMTAETTGKLLTLVDQGATILLAEKPSATPGWQNKTPAESDVNLSMEKLLSGKEEFLKDETGYRQLSLTSGKGRVLMGRCGLSSFDPLGIPPDFYALDLVGNRNLNLAWTHRKTTDEDIYFIASQEDTVCMLNLSFRVDGTVPHLFNPLNGVLEPCVQWTRGDGRTTLRYRFLPRESVFVIFREETRDNERKDGVNWVETEPEITLDGEWKVVFDAASGGPAEPVVFSSLADWSLSADDRIRYYSGTAVYRTTFSWHQAVEAGISLYLDPGIFHNVARVTLNGQDCGTCWTPSPGVRIDGFIREGENTLEIGVTNTWHNRILGDHHLPSGPPVTWTTAPYRLRGRELLPSGLLGPVQIRSRRTW